MGDRFTVNLGPADIAKLRRRSFRETVNVG
jgi:hypothetical protein